MKNNSRFYWLMPLCLTAGGAYAEPLEIHGFVAQGIAQAAKSNAINNEGDVSLALTELGLNAKLDLHPRLKLSGQVVYLNGGNRYPEGARLDYFFLDFSAIVNFDHQLNVFLGRYKNQHWLFSSTRDVPFTRPSIILPQSVYYDAFRDIAVASDGLAIKGYKQLGQGELEYNWSIGSTAISTKQARPLLSPDIQGSAEQKYVHQASLFWQGIGSQASYGLSLLDSQFSYKAASVDFFADGDVTVQRVILNWRYQAEKWDLSSELFQERMTIDGFYAPGFQRSQMGIGGYVLGRYRYGSKLSALMSVDILALNKDDKRGSQLGQLGIPSYFGYQHSLMLGASYELGSNFRLQAEHHWVDGTGRLSPSLVPDLERNQHRYWQVWALQLMYWF